MSGENNCFISDIDNVGQLSFFFFLAILPGDFLISIVIFKEKEFGFVNFLFFLFLVH